ncbi:MAG: polysaccharide biosynthesis tyrosine autokinase, partial [Sulfurimonas sp.]|nr:polysaccharide biosynthesis tyrosine autokinase [Sulfurimonas sp.]
ALGSQGDNVDNEIGILQSRYIASKALENLNIGTRYFTKKNFKMLELYQATPFIVRYASLSDKVIGLEFKLKPLSENSFQLKIDPTLKEVLYRKKNAITYSQTHKYGKEIVTPWFTIKIQRIYELQNEEYSFKIIPNEEMVPFITNSLSVYPLSGQGTILELSFRDNVPARAADILNALTSAYLADELTHKQTRADKTLKFLDKQLEGLYKTLKASEKNLQVYKSTNQVVSLEDKASASVSKLAELKAKLYELNTRINIMENIRKYIKNNQDINAINLDSLDVSKSQNTIISQIQEQKILLRTLLVDYTELHPDVLKVMQNLESLKKSLQYSVEARLQSAQNEKRNLTKAIQEQTEELTILPEQQKNLASLTRNFVSNEKLYTFLLEKRAETAIIHSSTVSETRIIDSAYVPASHIEPKRMIIVIIGMLIGFIIGAVLAFLRNFLDDTIKTVDDVELHTGIPLYGVLPEKVDDKISQPYFEALRVLRTNLEFLPNNDGKAKVVTITSSVPIEGKTTVVSEVAKIMAMAEKKVIVLDLDMRRARIHEQYELQNTNGMSTFLANKDSFHDVLQHTHFENLDVITAGPIPPNPSELLLTNRMKELIEDLSRGYDYIFLDTPPIGLVADAMTLMKVSDVNLFVVRANYSKKDFLKNINRFVEEQHLENSGILINMVKLDKKSGYGYGYGYGYGTAGEYSNDD